MLRSLKLALLTLLLSLTLVGGSEALQITKVGKELVRGFQYAAPAQAKGYLAGYTVLAKLGRVQKRVLNILPISTVAILYFAPDGTLLGWSDKSDIVERGTWQVKTAPNGNDLCIFFDKGRGAGMCTVLIFGGPQFLESTKGNPFGLKANAAVPYDLGRFGVSLGNVAKKLGL